VADRSGLWRGGRGGGRHREATRGGSVPYFCCVVRDAWGRRERGKRKKKEEKEGKRKGRKNVENFLNLKIFGNKNKRQFMKLIQKNCFHKRKEYA
jgi:hypothetical protein